MNNSLYYGEIAAMISGKLHQNPDHLTRISNTINHSENSTDSIWTICADAAKVFDKIEDLSGEHYIDWHNALENYSCYMLDFLLSGRKPNVVDMISMTTLSIESAKQV